VQQRVHRRAEEDGLLVPGGDAGGGQLLPRGCLQGSGGADGREAAGTRVSHTLPPGFPIMQGAGWGCGVRGAGCLGVGCLSKGRPCIGRRMRGPLGAGCRVRGYGRPAKG
jgi:hypothetical protein